MTVIVISSKESKQREKMWLVYYFVQVSSKLQVNNRNSHQKVFCKKAILKKIAKLTGEKFEVFTLVLWSLKSDLEALFVLKIFVWTFCSCRKNGFYQFQNLNVTTSSTNIYNAHIALYNKK